MADATNPVVENNPLAGMSVEEHKQLLEQWAVVQDALIGKFEELGQGLSRNGTIRKEFYGVLTIEDSYEIRSKAKTTASNLQGDWDRTVNTIDAMVSNLRALPQYAWDVYDDGTPEAEVKDLIDAIDADNKDFKTTFATGMQLVNNALTELENDDTPRIGRDQLNYAATAEAKEWLDGAQRTIEEAFQNIEGTDNVETIGANLKIIDQGIVITRSKIDELQRDPKNKDNADMQEYLVSVTTDVNAFEARLKVIDSPSVASDAIDSEDLPDPTDKFDVVDVEPRVRFLKTREVLKALAHMSPVEVLEALRARKDTARDTAKVKAADLKGKAKDRMPSMPDVAGVKANVKDVTNVKIADAKEKIAGVKTKLTPVKKTRAESFPTFTKAAKRVKISAKYAAAVAAMVIPGLGNEPKEKKIKTPRTDDQKRSLRRKAIIGAAIVGGTGAGVVTGLALGNDGDVPPSPTTSEPGVTTTVAQPTNVPTSIVTTTLVPPTTTTPATTIVTIAPTVTVAPTTPANGVTVTTAARAAVTTPPARVQPAPAPTAPAQTAPAPTAPAPTAGPATGTPLPGSGTPGGPPVEIGGSNTGAGIIETPGAGGGSATDPLLPTIDPGIVTGSSVADTSGNGGMGR